MKKKGDRRLIGLGLVSGGLDSLVASLLIRLQDIEVIGLNFKSPFCICDKAYSHSECGLNLFYNKLGIKVYTLLKGDDYLEIVRNPKFGYGKNLNPCIDCRIYILNKAQEFMQKVGADFIFTGEVLNQRPKSQNLKALKIIEVESGLQGKLLRPLSALLLKPTIYEEQGLIDRAKLLGIKGRSRKIQLELVRKHNLLENYFACGGCLLTDKNFSNRMSDYLKHTNEGRMEDINLLKLGRHFRYNTSKIIVGRDEIENKLLLQIKNPQDIAMEVKNIKGPISIIQGVVNQDVLEFAGKLTLRYSDLKEELGVIMYGKNYSLLKNEITVKKEKLEIIDRYIL